MAAPDRTRLPLDVDTSARPIRPVEAVPGSPNVVIVLIDDMGFGASSAYGGPCEMPTAQRLADDGLRYSRFHVTSLCSPTRQALMTGRNHHSVGMGVTSEMSTPEPGYHGYRPASAATIAQILSGNGYCTAAVGKWHQTPPVEVSPSGPFQRWPMGEGFDFFYGFMGAEMNHWYPQLYQGRYAVEPDRLPEDGYHLSEDLVDNAISWVENQQAITPERPFFTYLALGATHAPFHVAAEWRDKYAGRFDDGWDAQRDRTLARQKELGIVPGVRRAGPLGRGRAALGRARRDRAARRRAVHGDLRRVRRARRRAGRPVRRRPGGDGRPRRHADLLPARRQRGLRRGRPARHLPRAPGRARHPGRHRRHGRPAGHARRPDDVRHLPGRLGAGDEHAVPVDQAARAPRRHARRHDRALGQRDRGPRRDPPPVAPRHRRAAHHPRGRGARGPRVVRRRGAAAGRGHQPGLQLRRRRRSGPAQHAVLRDDRQPRRLPRRLDRRDPPRRPLGDGGHPEAALRRGRLGALRPRRRLEPGARPGREGARAAAGAPGRLPARGREVPGAPPRRPGDRAGEPRRRGPARPAPRPLHAVVRPAGRATHRGGGPQRQEPLPRHHCRPRGGHRHQRGRRRPGWPVRRVVPVRRRRRPALRLQLRGPRPHGGPRRQADGRRAATTWSPGSPTTADRPAAEPTSPSRSTASPSGRGASR